MEGELALELLSRLLVIDSPRLLSLAILSPLRIIQKSKREGEIHILDFRWTLSSPPDGLGWRLGHNC